MYTLQTIGAILGLLGAFLVTARSSKVRYLAFSIWVISNLLLVIVFYQLSAWPLIAMQSGYLATSILGIINNLPKRNHAD